MKKCNEHHGEIQYDEKIYLECPLCKVADYGEIVRNNEYLQDELSDVEDGLQKVIDVIEEMQDKLS